MKGFIRVGRAGDFPNRRGRAVSVEGLEVAVFRVDDRYHALQDACPHMGASLADGTLSGDSVVCHWHGWKFRLETGQGDMRSWACARVFEVRVENGEVWIRRPGPGKSAARPGQDDTDADWISWDPDRFFKP